MSRKRIALITINPDDESIQRIMTGIFNQCRAYDYDVAVISPMVHITNFFKDYLYGELNIYELINFDLFDGVIITPIPMQEEQITTLTDALLDRLQKECHVPVVSINLKFGDYDVVYADERRSVKAITEHLITVHHCEDIAVLTGPKDFPISEERIDGVRETMEAHGLTLPEDRIFYGDFWYTSGEKLAERIAAKEIKKPQAVVCASDHMAIGLVNALLNAGICVPEEIIVTGNGGSREAAINLPTITTFDADESYTGAAAVNVLRKKIEPQSVVYGVSHAGNENICIGGTCGCPEDSLKLRMKLRNILYTSYYNDKQFSDSYGTSLTMLLDSYISEHFTSTADAENCLNKIYESIYLLKPYGYFYLCLNEHWMSPEADLTRGYPEKMNMAISCDQAKKLHGYINHVFFGPKRERLFDTKKMLPAFEEEFPTPQVFYFTPIHFEKKSIGYAVLQNDLTSPIRIGNVYRNYIRYISNALEMSRAKDFARNLSEHDMMTGLYNRRGMERVIEEYKYKAGEGDQWFAMVIDMNNLKLINDNLGHEIGDQGICMIARAVQNTVHEHEVGVRGGGDEFYVVGIGAYTEEDIANRVEEFQENLDKERKAAGLGQQISAAAGAAIKNLAEDSNGSAVLDDADVAMYVDKRNRKRMML